MEVMGEVVTESLTAKETRIDFPQKFKETLKTCDYTLPAESVGITTGLGKAGILRVKRLVPCVIFDTGNISASEWHLALTDAKAVADPHKKILEELKPLLPQDSATIITELAQTAYVAEDQTGKLSLLLSNLDSKITKELLESPNQLEPFKKLIKNYGLLQIVGKVSADEHDYHTVWGEKVEVLVREDTQDRPVNIADERQRFNPYQDPDESAIALARENHLTNTQALKLASRLRAGIEWPNYQKLIVDILDEE